MAVQPDEGRLNVEGAEIAWSAWGDRGKTGLLLLIGNGAHMGWWRPLAAMLAKDFRVASFDWSGMGASDWREEYPIALLNREALRVAEEAGLFDAAQKPFVAAHSFGGFISLGMLNQYGNRFGGGILVDSRLKLKRHWGPAAESSAAFHIHGTKAEAMARFRFIPDQPMEHPYYVKMLAENAIVKRAGGWQFRQDHDFRRKTPLQGDMLPLLAHAKCPLAIVRGALTTSVTDELWAAQQAAAAPGTVFVEIPMAHHHIMVDRPCELSDTIRDLIAAFPRRSANDDAR